MTPSSGRPVLSMAAAERLAREHFGLAATARPLPGYLDRNVLLTTGDGRRYVLKVAHAAEDPGALAFQQAVLARLAAADLPFRTPRVCPAPSGETLLCVPGEGGLTHLTWLVEWLPGTFLADVTPQTPVLRRRLGAALGHLDRALDGFAHPAMHRDLPWNMALHARLPARFDDVADPDRRARVVAAYGRFEETAGPLLPGLRTAVIHNDANDHNVLLDAAGRVSGLIDFGDATHTYLAAEVAIAATYALLGQPDPLAAAADVVAGYHAVYPLTEDEVAALFGLILLRLCTSVCVSARQRRVEPDNAYLAVSEAPAWAALDRLAPVPAAWATATFREACGWAPCPRAAAVVRRLRRETPAPVVTPPPMPGNTVVVDLGARSPLASHFGDVAALTEALFGRVRAAGGAVGLGRYDEDRAWYTSPLFTADGRTLHLGVDLFLPAGTPVHAPLDGRIHSFRDNAGALDYGPTILLEHPGATPEETFFTLYGHLSRASLAGLRVGQVVRRGDRLGTLGTPDENGGWPPHLHLQIVCDLLGNAGDYPGVCAPAERERRLSFSPDPDLILRMHDTPDRSAEALRARRARYLGPSLSLSYDVPLKIVRGRGAYLYDAQGRRYLDAVNNVCHVGHCHPRVVEAACRQMAVLNTNTRYLHDHLVDYAERLAATLPDPLQVCFFVNSGSEANDLALRLARAHTGRRGVVVVDGAYHGNLSSLIELSPYKFDGPGGEGAPPHVRVVPMPDPYRGPHRGPDAGARYADAVREAVAGGDVGAFFCESLLGCGGQIEPPEGYLAAAFAHVRAAGGLCVADEVQVGFGRVGTHFWGFEAQGVVPDIVTMGKPIGNGHPLGAVVTTPEIAASFANGMEYFNTFGGNPVSCAVGLAVLDVLADEGLQAHAHRVGGYLKDRLRDLAGRYPLLGDVRGRGLFLGVELVRDRETREPAAEAAAAVVNRMKERGVLLSTDGPLHNVLKIKPPLVFSDADADRLVDTLEGVLRAG